MSEELLRELLIEIEELAERHADDRQKNLEWGAEDAAMVCLRYERHTRSVIRRARRELRAMIGGAV